MKNIASFCIDHDKLTPGMYVSRIDRDIVTYDVRMKKPNGGDYLPIKACHTIEHLFATYVRNSAFDNCIVYVGPMGCLTGFYLLVRDMTQGQALNLTYEAFRFIAAYEGEIPGAASSKECGNYLAHDLAGAKKIAAEYCEVIKDWNVEKMKYPE